MRCASYLTTTASNTMSMRLSIWPTVRSGHDRTRPNTSASTTVSQDIVMILSQRSTTSTNPDSGSHYASKYLSAITMSVSTVASQTPRPLITSYQSSSTTNCRQTLPTWQPSVETAIGSRQLGSNDTMELAKTTS